MGGLEEVAHWVGVYVAEMNSRKVRGITGAQ